MTIYIFNSLLIIGLDFVFKYEYRYDLNINYLGLFLIINFILFRYRMII